MLFWRRKNPRAGSAEEQQFPYYLHVPLFNDNWAHECLYDREFGPASLVLISKTETPTQKSGEQPGAVSTNGSNLGSIDKEILGISDSSSGDSSDDSTSSGTISSVLDTVTYSCSTGSINITASNRDAQTSSMTDTAVSSAPAEAAAAATTTTTTTSAAAAATTTTSDTSVATTSRNNAATGTSAARDRSSNRSRNRRTRTEIDLADEDPDTDEFWNHYINGDYCSMIMVFPFTYYCRYFCLGLFVIAIITVVWWMYVYERFRVHQHHHNSHDEVPFRQARSLVKQVKDLILQKGASVKISYRDDSSSRVYSLKGEF